MNQPIINIASPQEEWLKVLGKGMVTLPKKWRDELGIAEGSVVKAKKQGNRVVIEAAPSKAPYRVYSDKEIEEFLAEDALPAALAQKVEKHVGAIGHTPKP